MRTVFYCFQKIILPKRFYKSILGKEIETLNLEIKPRKYFCGLVMRKLLYIDNGLPIKYFLLDAFADGIKLIERTWNFDEDLLIYVIIKSAKKAILKVKKYQIRLVL